MPSQPTTCPPLAVLPRTFKHKLAAVPHQLLCIDCIQLMLRGAGEGRVDAGIQLPDLQVRAGDGVGGRWLGGGRGRW